MPCENTKFVGRDVVLEYYIGCGDTLPLPNQWKRLGSMRTKEFNLEWETTDATDDSSIGKLREMLATFLTLGISGDGTVKVSDGDASNLVELTKHVANPEATNGQPNAWVRLTFPDLTFTAYMIVTNMSRSAPYDDVATYSFESSSTASDFGLLVDDTPDPDAADVASVDVTPATVSLAVGAFSQLTVAVLPGDAPSGVTYVSSSPAVATVSQNGLITAVSAGSATIAVRANADQTKTDTCVVTVTA